MPETSPPWRCARCLRCPPYVRRINSAAPVCAACRDALAARGLRWCAGCAASRPPAAFATGKGRCRPCVAALQRAQGHRPAARYRARNREALRAKNRAYMRRRRAADPGYARREYRRQRLAHARRLLRQIRGAA